MWAAAGVFGNIIGEREYLERISESRERTQNKALLIVFIGIGLLLVIAGEAMHAAKFRPVSAAGRGAVKAGFIALIGAMVRLNNPF